MLVTMYKLRELINKTVDFLPIGLPSALAGFSLVAVLLLVLNDFRTYLVWPIGLFVAGLTTFFTARHFQIDAPGDKYEQRLCVSLLLIGVALWTIGNSYFTSQHIFTNRDPATYAVAGEWLVSHDSIKMAAHNAFPGVHQIIPNSAGFAYNKSGNFIEAQGNHLLPALLGLGGRIVGHSNLLKLNVLFGGMAILAFYGFTRLIVRPRWALLASVGLAASLPLIYFSRDTYTEPLSATFTFSALALLWIAVKTQRSGMFAMAGLVAGAGALTRIDAYLYLAALTAFAIIYWLLGPANTQLKRLKCTLTLIMAGMAGGILGWIDITTLSNAYYHNKRKEILAEIALIAFIAIIGVIARFLQKYTNFWRWVEDKAKERITSAFSWIIALTILLLLLHPLWYHSYSSLAAWWLVWYIGPVSALASVAGFIIMGREFTKELRVQLLAPLIAIGSVATFYLYRPSIASDQIWASRRLVPVILPGALLFSAVALQYLYQQGTLKKLKNIKGRTLSIIGATMLVAGPLSVSWISINWRFTTQLGVMEKVCHLLPPNAAVVWVGSASRQMVEPTSVFCNRPTMAYARKGNVTPTQASLAEAAKIARKNGYTPILGSFGSDADSTLLNVPTRLTTAVTFSYKQLEQSFAHPPTKYNIFADSFKLGLIRDNGTVVPLVD